MKKADVIAHIEAMYNHLQDARVNAAALLEVFSEKEWKGNRRQLREICRKLRGFTTKIPSKEFALYLVEVAKEGEHE